MTAFPGVEKGVVQPTRGADLSARVHLDDEHPTRRTPFSVSRENRVTNLVLRVRRCQAAGGGPTRTIKEQVMGSVLRM